MKIAVINGPNLNFLGIREPKIYGVQTLEDINDTLRHAAKNLSTTASSPIEIEFFQSNHEGDIVNFLQNCYNNKIDGIIFNPAAFSHYSYALRDAVSSISIPTVEVHLSNIAAREEFRQKSVIAPVCCGQISGFGADSYVLALHALVNLKTEE